MTDRNVIAILSTRNRDRRQDPMAAFTVSLAEELGDFRVTPPLPLRVIGRLSATQRKTPASEG